MQPTRERWLPVTGFEGLYEVSDQGRVRSLPRITTKNQRVKGRVLKPTFSGFGYGTVKLCCGGRGLTSNVHVLVATAFHGPTPEGAEGVRHLNGDETDNRAENLRWGTQSQNAYDTIEHGRHFNASKTHCKRGHEFTPENTIPRPTTGRWCRACRVLYREQARQRRAQARLALAS